MRLGASPLPTLGEGKSWHGGQVPGAGGSHSRLLRNHVQLLGRAARHGIPVQRKPAECGNLSRKGNLCLGRIARNL
jgi:hypothetical protein